MNLTTRTALCNRTLSVKKNVDLGVKCITELQPESRSPEQFHKKNDLEPYSILNSQTALISVLRIIDRSLVGHTSSYPVHIFAVPVVRHRFANGHRPLQPDVRA